MVDIINMGGPFSFCMFLFIIPCIRSAYHASAVQLVKPLVLQAHGHSPWEIRQAKNFFCASTTKFLPALFRTAHCFRVHYTIQSQDIYQNFHNYF